MKFFEFFRKCMGKMVGAGAGAKIFDKLELEQEPKFLTSWSRSRTKMDRLRNTVYKGNFYKDAVAENLGKCICRNPRISIVIESV
jgi:hypothetical protein